MIRNLVNASALGFVVALLHGTAAYAAADIASLPRDLSAWGMFKNADIVVKVVMAGLALASLEIGRAHV